MSFPFPSVVGGCGRVLDLEGTGLPRDREISGSQYRCTWEPPQGGYLKRTETNIDAQTWSPWFLIDLVLGWALGNHIFKNSPRWSWFSLARDPRSEMISEVTVLYERAQASGSSRCGDPPGPLIRHQPLMKRPSLPGFRFLKSAKGWWWCCPPCTENWFWFWRSSGKEPKWGLLCS